MADSLLGTIRGVISLDIKDATASLTKIRQDYISTFSALGQLAGTLDRIGASFLNVGKTIVGAFTDASVAYGEFERKLDYMAVVAEASEKEIESLGQMVRQLGADTIYTNDEVAEGFIELAKAGVQAKDILGGVGEGITYLGAAADIGLEQAATMMMSVVQTWGMAADEAGRVADVLAGTANASMVEIDDLGISMKYAGSVAASLGIEFDDVAAALGILGKRAIRGSTAGTSLRQMMIGLVGNTEKAKKKMAELGIITEDGSNKFFNQEGKIKSLSDVMEILKEATADMGEEQKIAALKTMFNVRSLPSVLTLLEAGAEGFEEMTEAIQGVSAADVAAARLDNLSGALEYLQGEWDNLKLSFGEIGSKYLIPLVRALENLISWFNGLSMSGKQTVLNMGLLVAGLALLTGGIFTTMGMVTRAAETFYSFKTLMSGVTKTLKLTQAQITATGRAFGMFLKGFAIIGIIVGLLYAFFTQTEQGREAWEKIVAVFQETWEAIKPAFDALGQAFDGLLKSIFSIGKAGGEMASTGWEAALTFLADLLVGVAQVIGEVVKWLSEWLIPALTVIVDIINGPVGAVLGAMVGAILAVVAALKVWAVVQGILNFLLTANPIGIIIMAIAALVAAIIWVATQTTFFQDAWAAITSWFRDVWENVSGFFIGLWENISSWFTGVIDGIVSFFTSAWQGVVDFFVGIWEPIKAPVEAVFSFFYNIVKFYIEAWINVFIIIAAVVKTVVDWVVAKIAALVEGFKAWIEPFVEWWGAVWETMKAAIVLVWALIVTWVKEKIAEFVDNVITPIVTMYEEWVAKWEAFKEALAIAWNLLVGIVKAKMQEFYNNFIQPIVDLVAKAQAKWEEIKNFIAALLVAMVIIINDKAKEFYERFIQPVVDAYNKVKEYVSKFTQAAKDLIQGFINGIKNMVNKVKDTVTGLFDNVLGWAKGVLGIASPSKEFRKIGEYMGAGLAIGIESTEAKVEKALVSMLNSTRKVFQGLIDDRDAAIKKLNDLEFKQANAKTKSAVTAKAIAEQKQLIKDLNWAINQEASVISRMEAANSRLLEIAKDRDLITAKLTAAQKSLKKLENGQLSHYGDFLDDMQRAVAVTNKSTIEGMIYAVENQISKTQEFNDLIENLHRRGLDQASIEELVEQFMANGSLTSARALASASDDALQSLVTLRKQLGVEAAKTAESTSSIMYDAGIDAAQGLVDGLQAELDAVNAIAEEVANTLTNTVESQLGIASPSKEMKLIGGQVMDGLVIGIAQGKNQLAKQLADISSVIAQFNDQWVSTKQFEIETMMTLRASDEAQLAMAVNGRYNDNEKLDQLLVELKKLNAKTLGNTTYEIGDIMIPLRDLETIKTLEDFLEMVKVYKRQRG